MDYWRIKVAGKITTSKFGEMGESRDSQLRSVFLKEKMLEHKWNAWINNELLKHEYNLAWKWEIFWGYHLWEGGRCNFMSYYLQKLHQVLRIIKIWEVSPHACSREVEILITVKGNLSVFHKKRPTLREKRLYINLF